MQIEYRAHDRYPAVRVSAKLDSLPAAHGVTHVPDPFFLFSGDRVTHGWSQGGRGVRVEIVGQDVFHLPTALGRQSPEGVIFIGVIAEQVNAGVIEGPLGMACLTAY